MLATQANFKELGLDKIIFSHHRDVLSNGFICEDGAADAVFLDLPAPWQVVEEANRCLHNEGNFCSFSPCIEQIQKTCDKLREFKFEDIRVVECLLRNFDINPRDIEPLNLQKKRENDKTLNMGPTEKNEVENNAGDSQCTDMDTKSDVAEPVLGKRKAVDMPELAAEDSEEQVPKPRFSSKIKKFRQVSIPSDGIGVKPVAEIKGHTSYLLFARKPRAKHTQDQLAAAQMSAAVQE